MPNNSILPTIFEIWQAPFMDPYRAELFSVGKRMDEWVNEVNQKAHNWCRMNYYSSATEHIYEFIVPGMTKDDIGVSITNQNELNIKSVSAIEHEKNTREYHHQEFSCHPCYRKIVLPEDTITDQGTIKANVVDGILTVTFKRICHEDNDIDATNVIVN